MINKQTRYLWAEKTFELTNIAVGVLIFGQFFSGEKFQTLAIIIGVILAAFGYLFSYFILKGGGRR